jgi:hypothetical protein
VRLPRRRPRGPVTGARLLTSTAALASILAAATFSVPAAVGHLRAATAAWEAAEEVTAGTVDPAALVNTGHGDLTGALAAARDLARQHRLAWVTSSAERAGTQTVHLPHTDLAVHVYRLTFTVRGESASAAAFADALGETGQMAAVEALTSEGDTTTVTVKVHTLTEEGHQ